MIDAEIARILSLPPRGLCACLSYSNEPLDRASVVLHFQRLPFFLLAAAACIEGKGSFLVVRARVYTVNVASVVWLSVL